ncbi:MAG TPA: DUF4384 domain-containing protein [Blastocatellia bacterium]|nr:DUF4384 domain-containing protein [Blastocatellia bacterium]
MNRKLFSLALLTLLVGGSLVESFIRAVPVAADSGSYYWDEPVAIKQPAKPKAGRRRTTARPAANSKGEELSPLLTFKYKLLERAAGGDGRMVDAAQTDFSVGDQLRLSLTPNQHGYLYVIHHSVDNNNNIVDQPHVIFPSPRINEGRNEVNKNETYVVPKFCPEFDDPKDCWWEITPPAGRDFFTVIFSRDEITDLPSSLTEADVTSNAKDAVALKTLEAFNKERDANKQSVARTKQIRFKSNRTTDEDGVFVQNTNRKDNEELIDTIELRHSSEASDTEATRARALFVKKRNDAMRVQFFKDGREVDPADVFKAGEEVQVRYESNFNGYIYMVNITPAGEKRVIFPCARAAAINLAPGQIKTLPVSFDQEKGTEVLQVIMSRDRIDFLENAIKGDCCENPEKCALSASASSAAAELAAVASKRQKGGIEVNNLVAVVPDTPSRGIRARGIKLAQGSSKGSAYVAIEPRQENGSGKLEQGNYAVFEIRLSHN